MKTSLFCVLFLVNTSVMAATYSCTSSEQESAVLEIQSHQRISWSNESRGESSNGRFHHIEQGPYSALNGQLQYQLSDFYLTNDSGFYLSIPKSIASFPSKVIVTLYFDHDDHTEEEVKYLCTRESFRR